jgi:LacI family transcriptional regulator
MVLKTYQLVSVIHMEKKRYSPITITDIAQALKINSSTVSRALSDSSVVKLSTKKIIQEYAIKHNYQPNFAARSLQNKKTFTIGILLPKVVHEFFGKVLLGVQRETQKNGYRCLVFPTNDDLKQEINETENLLNGGADGIIMCYKSDGNTDSHIKELIERRIPLVFVDIAPQNLKVSKVIIDDMHAGYMATKHLLEAGAFQIACICGPRNINNLLRAEGYRKAINESEYELNSDLIIFNENLIEGEELGMVNSKKLLKTYPLLNGVFTSTDMLATGFIKVAKKQNLRVPEDIKVIGFSNWAISMLYEPSISTVDQPGYEMGQKAAQLLFSKIDSPTKVRAKTVIIETKVIQRESSKVN